MKTLATLCSFALLAAAQNTPDAKALLKETRDVLRNYKSYELEQRAVVDMAGPTPARFEMLVKMAVSSPGKLRIESSGQVGTSLIVSDGENTWTYIGMLKQYTKTAAASSPENLVKSLVPGAGDMLDQFKNKDPYVSAKSVGEETVEVGGEKIDCYVVEARLDNVALPGSMEMKDGVQKLWIGKVSKLTLKQTLTATVEGGPLRTPTQLNQAVTVTSEKLDSPVPDSRFVFTPPEGAKLVAEFKGMGNPNADLSGTVATDFKLKSLGTKEFSLEELRGKVVLLDFWATWCGPCRRDLPTFEKLHREFNEKGLVVLGLNAGEDAETVSGFLLSTKLSYPILLTAQSETLQSYNVSAFPTVVLIDREGKIAFYHVGAGSESALRESLTKLGFETIPSPATKEPKN